MHIYTCHEFNIFLSQTLLGKCFKKNSICHTSDLLYLKTLRATGGGEGEGRGRGGGGEGEGKAEGQK